MIMDSKKTASHQKNMEEISRLLKTWFDADKRQLPWRESKDPYLVWISEIMLQQTTTAVVRGYFKRFTKMWPNVKALAKASQKDVNEHWAGLGYYSRARNILKAAKAVESDCEGIFPRTAEELIQLPGIGPYTSRAISSICFDEPVGVVDDNVLRVHNRLIGEKMEWWSKDFFKSTQEFSDSLCQHEKSSTINPALMDLGSTVCTPKKVMCGLCPLTKKCGTFKNGLQNEIPLPKPRRAKEHWVYTVYKNKLDKNELYIQTSKEMKAPVLKRNLLPYGNFQKVDKKPSKFAFMHTVTHHNIYVQFEKIPKLPTRPKPEKTSLSELKRVTPSSLIEKIWQHDSFCESI